VSVCWAGMPTFLVDRDLPGVSRDQFRAAQRAAINAARMATAGGSAVRYIRGVFVPSEGRAVCLFEAPDAESVRAVNVAAGVAFTHVAEAIELDGPDRHE